MKDKTHKTTIAGEIRRFRQGLHGKDGMISISYEDLHAFFERVETLERRYQKEIEEKEKGWMR